MIPLNINRISMVFNEACNQILYLVPIWALFCSFFSRDP
jgi:hypothetical protein